MSAVEKTLRWIVIGGIFLLPAVAVIVADNLFFPYITGKNFTFRVVVEVISGAWLALALVLPHYRPKRTWILGCFAIFVILMAIADAQGANPFKSFWSNYERMDGWVTIIHVLLLTVVAACVLNTEKLWRRFLQWSLWVSAYLSVLGLLQVANIVSFGGGSGNTGLEGRIDTTFGNPIYLAVYMLFNVFIAALLWYQEGKEPWGVQERIWYLVGIFGMYVLVASQLTSGAATLLFFYTLVFFGLMEAGMFMRRSWVLGVTIVLDTVALLFTATLGATGGLVVGAFLALLLYAFSSDGSKRLRQATVAAFVLLALAGGSLLLARNTPLVQSVGILQRVATFSFSENDNLARIINVEMAWKGIEERPILGWGQENYAIVFDKYYDPRMYAQEQWFDRVHDIVFDWWVAGGTLGLLAYLSIFAATLWALWRKGVFTAAERSILTGLLAGYFLENLTVFDNITSYILFATVLGYIVYRQTSANNGAPVIKREFLPKGSLPLIAALAAVVVLGSAWYVNANALAENEELIVAITPQADITQNLADFEKAISYGTYGTQEAREQLAQGAVSVVESSSISDTVKSEYVQESVQQMNLQAQVSPLDARFPLFAGTVLSAAGDYTDAAQYLEHAHELSPDKQSILFSMAQNAQLAGQTSVELQDLATAYNADTQDLDARLYYAAALITVGQYSQAATLLAPVIPTGQAADPRITSAYAAQKEYAPLIPIWQAEVKVDPTNIQNYFTLAAIYYANGDKTDSIATLQQAVTIDPSTQSQVQSLIQEINNGTLNIGNGS